MEFRLISHAHYGETLWITIPGSEWAFARANCPALFQAPLRDHTDDGAQNHYYLPLEDGFDSEQWRFLAFIGKLEVLHAKFLLSVMSYQPASISGASAARLLRRLYERLTISGGCRAAKNDIRCNADLDDEIALRFVVEGIQGRLVITAGRFARMIIGRSNTNIYALRRHFSRFGILVDVEEHVSTRMTLLVSSPTSQLASAS